MSTDNEIFFSYAWGDQTEKGTSREKIVNDLYQSLVKDGYKVIRDKYDLNYRGFISDFMVRIGQGKNIIVAVSNKYVKSPYCMYELYEIARNSNFDKYLFSKKVFPIMIDFIDFSKPKIIEEYFSIWEKEYKDWGNLVKKRADQLSGGQLQRFDKIKMIFQNFGKLSDWLVDMNTLNPKMLSKDNFNEIKKAIESGSSFVQTEIKEGEQTIIPPMEIRMKGNQEEVKQVKELKTNKSLLKKNHAEKRTNESNDWLNIYVKEIAKTNIDKTLEYTIITAPEKQVETYKINHKWIELISKSYERWTPKIGKTLFHLLLPQNVKKYLQKESKSNIVWTVDKDTFQYPWELLVVSDKALCLDVKMIRNLSISTSGINSKSSTENSALIIANPDTGGFLLNLPGAFQEGTLLRKIFLENGFSTTVLIQTQTKEIIKSFFSDDYKIMHFAAHGVYNEEQDEPSGIIIGKDIYLTTSEFRELSSIPELVFINCNFTSRTDIASTLIEIGVKAIIVADGNLDDNAAAEFSNVFYKNIFAGKNFSESVLYARRDVFEKFGHTSAWGVYQCYGDPFYTIQTKL